MPVTLEVADWQASRGGSAEALVLYREFRDKTGNHSVCPAIVDLLMRRSQYEEAQKELDIWRKATAPAVDSRQAIASALLLGERGKAAQAAEVVTAALKKDPDNASLYLVRAQIFFNDRTKEDIQAQVKLDLEKAVELGPSLSRPRELLQEWLLRELRFDEAVSQLMRLIEMRPSNPQYRLQLAQVYMRQERQDALAQLLAESIRLVDVPVWHQMRATMLRGKGDLDAAVRELATAYRMQKQPAAESVAQYAEALVDTKQAPEALALIAKHPDALKTSPLLNALYGRALAATDKAYAADASFAEAIRMASDNDNLMEGVVGQLQNLESPAATVRRLEQAGKSHPTVVLDVAVAKVLLQDGQTEAAQKILERIADSGSLAKDDVSIRPVVYWLQASLCHSTKQNVKARAAYEALLRMQPNNMAALNNLAILLADDMNLPEEALPLVMKAASNWRINDAERANVLDSLGHVQFLANRLPESIITFGRSLSLKDNVLTRVHMAEALAKQQRLVEARNELQRAQQTAQREHADKALLQQIAALLKSLDVPGSGAGAVSRSTASYLNEPDFLKKGAKSSSGFSGPPPAKGASPTESPAAANPPARGRSVFDEPEFLKKEGVPPAGPAAPLPPPPAPKAGA